VPALLFVLAGVLLAAGIALLVVAASMQHVGVEGRIAAVLLSTGLVCWGGAVGLVIAGVGTRRAPRSSDPSRGAERRGGP
jgi:hypothetical protein